jgi:hypothetical protein
MPPPSKAAMRADVSGIDAEDTRSVVPMTRRQRRSRRMRVNKRKNQVSGYKAECFAASAAACRSHKRPVKKFEGKPIYVEKAMKHAEHSNFCGLVSINSTIGRRVIDYMSAGTLPTAPGFNREIAVKVSMNLFLFS